MLLTKNVVNIAPFLIVMPSLASRPGSKACGHERMGKAV